MQWGLKKTASILIVFLAIIAPLLHAQVTWSISQTDLYLLIGLSIAIAAAFIGLAYMAAKLFQIQLLEAWVKIELAELLSSMMIAVFCVALIASVDVAARGITGESGSVIDSARSFLKDRVYADGKQIYLKLADAYFNVAKVASYSYTAGISIGVASVSTSASPASGAAPLVADTGQAMDSAANFMLLAAGESAFLKFFGTASLVMIPVAIFLRSFSLTRKVGAVLLAAVVASSVIYPAGMMVSREIYNSFRADMMTTASGISSVASPGNPPAASLVCSPFMQRFVQSPIPFLGGEMGWFLTICLVPCITGFLCEPCRMAVFTTFYILKSTFPLAIYYSSLLPFAQQIGSPQEILKGYYVPLLNFALPATAKYAVLSLVVFLIPLIIAMVLLRNLAIAFGGEPQLYGISKLV